MKLILLLLLLVAGFLHSECKNSMLDEHKVFESLDLFDTVETMEALGMHSSIRIKDTVSEQPMRGKLIDSDLPYESTEDLTEDEVVFSILSASKLKDEIIPLDRSILEELGRINVSALNTTNTAPQSDKYKNMTVECSLRPLQEDEVPFVVLANSTILQSVLTPTNGTNATIADCAVVLFYSSQCIFSARMAPHYNALARVFPGVGFYALDTSLHNGVHVRYGIVSVPNVLLFHNAKPIARFNESHVNLENLAAFVTRHTTLEHTGTLNVTSADMIGPVPATLNKKLDYVLIISWAFTIFCLCFWFLKSSVCKMIVECVRNTWNEAEAQHEHAD